MKKLLSVTGVMLVLMAFAIFAVTPAITVSTASSQNELVITPIQDTGQPSPAFADSAGLFLPQRAIAWTLTPSANGADVQRAIIDQAPAIPIVTTTAMNNEPRDAEVHRATTQTATYAIPIQITAKMNEAIAIGTGANGREGPTRATLTGGAPFNAAIICGTTSAGHTNSG